MTSVAASSFLPSLEQLRSHLPNSVRTSLQSARELERDLRTLDRDPLPTSVPSLDRLLSGGLPRGHLVELVGSRSSGRFSTVIQVVAGATSAGEDSVLIDLGDGLDPVDAVRAGADLSRLLWLRPANLPAALAAAEMVIGCGLPLVVMDLGLPPLRSGQRQESAWLRLARASRQRGCALLVASPYRVSGPAASAVLRASHVHPSWQSSISSGSRLTQPLLTGAASSLLLEKHRGHATGADAQHQPLTLSGSESMATPRPPRAPALIPSSHELFRDLPAQRRVAQR
jgi:hypothetical protein